MKLDWKHLFNWEIVAIKAPVSVIKNGCLVGFRVAVTYKYHGEDEEFYCVDDERLYTTYRSPKDAAQCAYKNHLHKMRKQINRQQRNR